MLCARTITSITKATAVTSKQKFCLCQPHYEHLKTSGKCKNENTKEYSSHHDGLTRHRTCPLPLETAKPRTLTVDSM